MPYSSSRSSKVDDFGTNRKRIYEFLLVINSNCGPILHRFWDTATYLLKIAYFSYPCIIRRPRSLSSLWNFTVKLTVRKLRVMGLLCGEGCVILPSTVFDWSTRVTDRRTDGRRHIARICCRALKTRRLRRFKSDQNEMWQDIVLRVNTYRLTKSDFRFNVTLSRWRHDVISRRKVLPPGEWTQSVCPALMQQHSASSWSIAGLHSRKETAGSEETELVDDV